MSAKTTSKRRASRRSVRSRGRTRRRSLSGGKKALLVVVVAVAGLAAIFFAANRGSGPGSATGGRYPFQVGEPGPGAEAPPIELPSTDGGMFDLASMRGKTVLLYFQEGLMCQPCWDQLKDVEASFDRFRSLGIDEIVTITTDPLDALRQKVADEGLRTPVLSDPGLGVSKTYETNEYGMMGSSRNGHSFIVVGGDGKIMWRGDYGGAPRHFMYIPIDTLVSDAQEGLGSDREVLGPEAP